MARNYENRIKKHDHEESLGEGAVFVNPMNAREKVRDGRRQQNGRHTYDDGADEDSYRSKLIEKLADKAARPDDSLKDLFKKTDDAYYRVHKYDNVK